MSRELWNTGYNFVLCRDRSSMSVHIRSGEWPLHSRQAILVPADDRVSSSDRCCSTPQAELPLGGEITPLCLRTRDEIRLERLSRGDAKVEIICTLHCLWDAFSIHSTMPLWMSWDCVGFYPEGKHVEQKKHFIVNVLLQWATYHFSSLKS